MFKMRKLGIDQQSGRSREGRSLGRFRQEVVDRWRRLVGDVEIDRTNDRIEGDVGL